MMGRLRHPGDWLWRLRHSGSRSSIDIYPKNPDKVHRPFGFARAFAESDPWRNPDAPESTPEPSKAPLPPPSIREREVSTDTALGLITVGVGALIVAAFIIYWPAAIVVFGLACILLAVLSIQEFI